MLINFNVPFCYDFLRGCLNDLLKPMTRLVGGLKRNLGYSLF